MLKDTGEQRNMYLMDNKVSSIRQDIMMEQLYHANSLIKNHFIAEDYTRGGLQGRFEK